MANLILCVQVDIDPNDTSEFGEWLCELLFSVLTNEYVEDNVSVRFIGELYKEK